MSDIFNIVCDSFSLIYIISLLSLTGYFTVRTIVWIYINHILNAQMEGIMGTDDDTDESDTDESEKETVNGESEKESVNGESEKDESEKDESEKYESEKESEKESVNDDFIVNDKIFLDSGDTKEIMKENIDKFVKGLYSKIGKQEFTFQDLMGDCSNFLDNNKEHMTKRAITNAEIFKKYLSS